MPETDPETKSPQAAPSELPMPPGVGAVFQPAPEPPLSELLCVRGPEEEGPCTHLWEFQTNFEHGNPDGTFETLPRHNRRICLCGTEEMDLAGTAVYSCNRYKTGGNFLVELKKGK